MTNRYTIDVHEDGRADGNLQQVIALELATGCSLPNRIEDWPVGLVGEWNIAADAGAFAGSRTLGDMARAFLAHRLERLGRTREKAAA